MRNPKQSEPAQLGALAAAYEKSYAPVAAAVEKEGARLLHVRTLCLEQENASLRLKLQSQSNYVGDLERCTDRAEKATQARKRQLERLEEALDAKSRETQKLKAEVNSFRSISADSARVLTEKLALSRELSTLKLELEHLRAQCASSERLLADKLSLQRDLNSARVELETEKRSLQRLLSKDDLKASVEGKLKSEIEALQVDLANERRDRRRYESERRDLKIEFEGKQTLLESKVEALRGRLKGTREQLKETQVSIERGRPSSPNPGNAKKTVTTKTNPLKRTFQEAITEHALGTPSDPIATKKLKRGSALPGDKSHFSITPYLNRTASIAPASPASDEKDGAALALPNISGNGHSTIPSETTALIHSNGVGEGNGRGRSLKSGISKDRMTTKLDQVQEELMEDPPVDARQNVSRAATVSGVIDRETKMAKQSQVAPSRRRRKLLGTSVGKTLFDDDDAEMARTSNARDQKPAGSRKVLLPPRWGAPGGQLVGTFSPLKRDKVR